LNNGNKIMYACGGVRVTTHAGMREITHRGLVAGFRAFIAYYPEHDVSVACLTNDRSFDMDEIHQIVGELLTGSKINSPKPVIELPSQILERLRGLYKAENHFRTIEIKTDGRTAMVGADTLIAVTRDSLVAGTTIYTLGSDR